MSEHKPIYSNTDQGSQFTSSDYVNVLQESGIQISMDSKGCFTDNIMIERLWQSLKYEDIYLNHYESVPELQAGLESYFHTYNYDRLHESLGYKTPFEVFKSGIEKGGDL